jgi:hypothetical protein
MFIKLKVWLIKRWLKDFESAAWCNALLVEKLDGAAISYLIKSQSGGYLNKHEETVKLAQKHIKIGLENLVGFVYRNSDHAGMTIIAEGKERFLVTSESMELMEPQGSCYQNDMKKALETIQSRLWNETKKEV